MGRHHQQTEPTAPMRLPQRPAPRPAQRLRAADLFTWPMAALIGAGVLVLGVIIGLLIG